MDNMDTALDKIEARQNDMAHESLMTKDLDYCLDNVGLPEIMHMLENVSTQASKYSHEICVRQLINKLENY